MRTEIAGHNPDNRRGTSRNTGRTHARADWVQFIRFVGLLVIEAWALWVCSELLNYHTLTDLWTWLGDHPTVCLLNFAVFFSILAFIAFLTNRFDGACQLGLLLLLIPLVSCAKLTWLLQPLVASDIHLVRRALEMLPSHISPLPALAIGFSVVLAILLMGRALRAIVTIRISAPTRILGCLTTLALPAALCAAPASLTAAPASDLAQAYASRGFAVSLLAGTSPVFACTPARYTRSTLAQVISGLPAPLSRNPRVTKPDVILVLSEAFCDPAARPGEQHSADLLPNYHTLQTDGQTLQFLTPDLANDVANLEYELLTACSLSLRPVADIPYMDHLGSMPMPSVVRHFGQNGYRTLAIYAGEGRSWPRNTIYPNLGFIESQVGIASPSPVTLGNYILQRLAIDTSPTPRLIFAVSARSLAPHTRPSSGTYVPSGTGGTDGSLLEAHAQDAREADAMLGHLVTHLRTRPRPTILVFVGNHTPLLPPGQHIYTRTGLATNATSPADRLALRQAPGLIWANYPLQLEYASSTISPNLLWADLLPAIGLEHRFYSGLLGTIRQQSPGLSRDLYVTPEGTASSQMPKTLAGYLKDYELIQYDITHGQRYSIGELFPLEQFTDQPRRH